MWKWIEIKVDASLNFQSLAEILQLHFVFRSLLLWFNYNEASVVEVNTNIDLLTFSQHYAINMF